MGRNESNVTSMIPFSRAPKILPILVAKAATGVGNSVIVNDYSNIYLELFTASNANLTVKIQGSFQSATTPPDFSSSVSSTNRWFLLASYDLSDPSAIVPGNTGYATAGTDFVKGIIVNTGGCTWLNIEVTARVAGSVSANAFLYNNQ